MVKHERNRGWRRWRQDVIIKKRLQYEVTNWRGTWSGYTGDFEFDDGIIPRWFDLFGSYYEFRSRTSWSPRRGRWYKTDYDNYEKRYYRPKNVEINRNKVNDEIKRLHSELGQ